MTDASDALLYLFVGGPLIVVGLYALAFVLAIGPLGWFVLGFLVVAGIATGRIWVEGGDAVERTNCPECGAPNLTDAEACEYCDAALEAA
jgi:hypothetical protein